MTRFVTSEVTGGRIRFCDGFWSCSWHAAAACWASADGVGECRAAWSRSLTCTVFSSLRCVNRGWRGSAGSGAGHAASCGDRVFCACCRSGVRRVAAGAGGASGHWSRGAWRLQRVPGLEYSGGMLVADGVVAGQSAQGMPWGVVTSELNI